MIRKVTFAIAVLLALVSAIVVGNLRRDSEFSITKWKLETEPPLLVQSQSVERGQVVRIVEAPGEIEAEVEVEISSQVVGVIDELPVREGDRVTKGDLLVRIDDTDFQAALSGAQARVQRLDSVIASSEADIAKARRDVELSLKLRRSRSIGTTELRDFQTIYEKGKAALAMARAELLEAEAARKKAEEDVRDTVILSPIDGVVSQLVAEQGEIVVVGTMNNPGTKILVVSDMNTIVVRASVDETDIPFVQPDQRAVVHLQYDDDLTIQGYVKRISPKGIKPSHNNALTGGDSTGEVATFETIIALDSPPKSVRLGMTASVEIQVEQRDGVLRAPSQAVLHRRLKDLPTRIAEKLRAEAPRRPGSEDPARRYHQVVFVKEAGIARPRLVKTGVSDDMYVQILEGLEETDHVITGPYRIFDKLEDGRRVEEINDG